MIVSVYYPATLFLYNINFLVNCKMPIGCAQYFLFQNKMFATSKIHLPSSNTNIWPSMASGYTQEVI